MAKCVLTATLPHCRTPRTVEVRKCGSTEVRKCHCRTATLPHSYPGATMTLTITQAKTHDPNLQHDPTHNPYNDPNTDPLDDPKSNLELNLHGNLPNDLH